MALKLKIYDSIDEALDDVGNSKGHYSELTLNYDSENAFDQQEFEDYNVQLLEELISKGVDENNRDIVRIILSELTSNAYRHGVSNHPRENMLIMTYLSKQGALLGTKQNKCFLKNEQIRLLKQGISVPSTYLVMDRISSNKGTEFIIEHANGLLINKKEKEIYASKLF